MPYIEIKTNIDVSDKAVSFLLKINTKNTLIIINIITAIITTIQLQILYFLQSSYISSIHTLP